MTSYDSIKRVMDHLYPNIGLCIDISHSYLYCTKQGINFQDFLVSIREYSDYFHISDALGTDGEGLNIGDGEINFVKLRDILFDASKSEPVIVPEVWEGHLDNFGGFKIASKKLRDLGISY